MLDSLENICKMTKRGKKWINTTKNLPVGIIITNNNKTHFMRSLDQIF